MKSKKNIKSIVILAALGIATLFFINISLAANTAKVNVETANLRETADSESKILVQLSLNQEVEVVEKGNEWCKVKVNGITGYIREDLITINGDANTEKQLETSTEEKNENVQNEETTVEQEKETKKIVKEDTKLKIVPSINATEIIEVKKDQEVTITETINGWVCIQTETAKGWIRNDKLKSVEEKEEETTQSSNEEKVEEAAEEVILKTLYINTDTVNLRKEASTDSEIITRLSINTSVDVYAEENGWSRVKVNGSEGYISSSLLSAEKKETSRSQSTPRTQTTQSTTATTETTTVPSSGKGATVVETAKNYIGCSYVYGASGPSSFDCSGFTSYVFKLHGVSLNRTAAGQYSNGVAVSRDQLQPGDLVMFGKSGINHVGIYIGGGQIVHAANPSRGVTTDTINSGYYNNNYVGARRVI